MNEKQKLALQGIELGEFQTETHPYITFLWNRFSLKPPKARKALSHYESQLFELKSACDEFGVTALEDWYLNEFTPYAKKNGGSWRFDINGPQSLIKTMTGHAGKMRQRKTGSSWKDEYDN